VVGRICGLSVWSGRCMWNVMLVAPVPMSTSSPRRTPPVLGTNSSLTLVGRSMNVRFFSTYRRWTWRCRRRYWVGLIDGAEHGPCAHGQDPQRARHRGRATIAASHEDFRRPGQPRHTAHLEHSPTPEVSSGSLAGGRPHLVALARNTGLQRQSVGLSFGMAVVPTSSGRPPRHSFAFFSLFYFAP
jgi:hypothetical protein